MPGCTVFSGARFPEFFPASALAPENLRHDPSRGAVARTSPPSESHANSRTSSGFLLGHFLGSKRNNSRQVMASLQLRGQTGGSAALSLPVPDLERKNRTPREF